MAWLHDSVAYPFLIAPMFLLSVAAMTSPAQETKPDKLWVYIGTYSKGTSKGIYRCELDLATGQLSGKTLAGEIVDPSFVAIHPSHRFLYAVSESAAMLDAFAIDPKTGNLTKLNEHPSKGAGPCYITVDKQGTHALAANYGGGSFVVVPIGTDGRIGEASSFIQDHAANAGTTRRQVPRGHSINLDAANQYAVAADLGLDKLFVFRYDIGRGTLTANEPTGLDLAPGAGPRHFAFHPNGHNAYVINELNSTVNALRYDPEHGVLTNLQTLSTLPKDFKGRNSCAEVQVDPSGRFLYGSNRGHNSIAIFTIDSKTGELTAAGHQAEGIKTPRGFGIDPTGKFLIVGNQDGDNLLVFRIDTRSGALTPTGSRLEISTPVCVKFMPIPR
jgi:6-phosphogluconolactonase